MQREPNRIGKNFFRELLVAATESAAAELKEISVSQRLEYLLKEVESLGREDDMASYARRYVLCQFALAFHVKKGGLPQHRAVELIELATALLTIPEKKFGQDVQTIRCEAHALFGQVYGSYGRRWDALWQTELSDLLRPSSKHQHQNQVHMSYTYGRRIQRLGYAAAAVPHFESACRSAGAEHDLYAIELLRARFLAGDLNALTDSLAIPDGSAVSGAVLEELEWHRHLHGCLVSKDLTCLIQTVCDEGKFSSISYRMDLALWIYAWSNDRHRNSAPSAKYLKKKFGVSEGHMKESVRCVELLQDLYRKKTAHGVETIEQILLRKGRVLTLDREVLIHLALLRWLNSSKWHRVRDFVTEELAALGFRMTRLSDFSYWGLFDREVS